MERKKNSKLPNSFLMAYKKKKKRKLTVLFSTTIYKKQFFPFALISESNLSHLPRNTCIDSRKRVFGDRAPTDSIVTEKI